MPDPFEQVAWWLSESEYDLGYREARDLLDEVIARGQNTGLLKLVEERPEEPRESFINETAKVANRNYGTGGNPEAALYSAGHHPEGEPTGLDCSVRLGDVVEALRTRADEMLQTPAHENAGMQGRARDRADASLVRSDAAFIEREFIDHPQDR